MRWNLSIAGLAASWGFISVIVAGIDLDATVLVFWRLALAAVVLGVVIGITTPRRLALPRRPWRVLVVGAVLAAHWFLFFETIKRASVAVAVLTVYAAPVFLAALAPLFLPEPRSRVALVALAPATAGLVLIAVAGGEGGTAAGPAAVALGVGAAASYAGLVIATKRLAATLSPPTIAFWTYAVAAACLVPFLVTAPQLVPTGADAAYVALLGVVFTAASGLLYIWLLRRVTAQAVGILAYLEPVSAALLAWSILGQPLGLPVLAGGALVLAAGLLVVVREPGEAAVVEAPPVRPLPTGAAPE